MNAPVAICPCCSGPLQTSQIVVSLDTNSVAVGWSETVVKFTPKQAEIFAAIHQVMPRAAERSWLIGRVWGATEGNYASNNLDVQISMIRHQLPRIGLAIETLHGFGWRLVRKGG